jgi:hypothetical protein
MKLSEAEEIFNAMAVAHQKVMDQLGPERYKRFLDGSLPKFRHLMAEYNLDALGVLEQALEWAQDSPGETCTVPYIIALTVEVILNDS